ncbi:MAG: transposase [Tepidanaerobacteraceae bacterium]|nr:transposase [Tepidanaerobacteraceae bacterium]
MPRVARAKSKTGIYHMILRGINRQIIFEDKEDSIKFLQTFKEYKEKSEYEIYAYCLMGNHAHILIKEGKEELGTAMRRIGASYVYWYNWKYERTGHLFQDRYKSEAVEDDKYLLTVLRYIHQNPLKAGLVKDIKEYKWSSYNEYINKSKIIDSDFILDLFNRDREKAKKLFEEFHKIENNIQCLDIDENRRIKDSEAIEIIKEICNIAHCTDIQGFHKDVRNKYIKIIKEKGLSTRQIARLTGISRHIILKA